MRCLTCALLPKAVLEQRAGQRMQRGVEAQPRQPQGPGRAAHVANWRRHEVAQRARRRLHVGAAHAARQRPGLLQQRRAGGRGATAAAGGAAGRPADGAGARGGGALQRTLDGEVAAAGQLLLVEARDDELGGVGVLELAEGVALGLACGQGGIGTGLASVLALGTYTVWLVRN